MKLKNVLALAGIALLLLAWFLLGKFLPILIFAGGIILILRNLLAIGGALLGFGLGLLTVGIIGGVLLGVLLFCAGTWLHKVKPNLF